MHIPHLHEVARPLDRGASRVNNRPDILVAASRHPLCARGGGGRVYLKSRSLRRHWHRSALINGRLALAQGRVEPSRFLLLPPRVLIHYLLLALLLLLLALHLQPVFALLSFIFHLLWR